MNELELIICCVYLFYFGLRFNLSVFLLNNIDCQMLGLYLFSYFPHSQSGVEWSTVCLEERKK
ncbi:hypothetical protein, partial [Klebsiella pneumoniae]|uniref:hypothetical protein n=1 Tax=Klebsiella pneumoniae TaxID=573 RepID=UPI001C6FA801